ncbi:MAG: DUF4097 family beta strand repeat-containing protein [Holophagaceae bacterium]|nr:DUF4097 family beta strand repeat-containing protein [Holophagaceae bacterium]
MRSIAIIAALIAIPLMAQSTTIQPPTSANTTETRTFALQSGGKLDVSTINGRIKVTAWNKNEVGLTAEFKSDSDGKHTRLEVDSTTSSLELTVKHPQNFDRRGSRQSAVCNLELFVPSTIVGKINTVNGSIMINSVDGKLKLKTVNGSISLEDASGDIDVSATNGSIKGSVKDIEDNLDISTVNGSIKVKLHNPNGTLHASRVNGSVKVNTPGASNFESGKRNVKATFGNGKATYKIKTVNGSITID